MARLRTPHTSAPRGSRVRIVLRSGETMHARFMERTAQFVVVEMDGERKRLRGREIQSFCIDRSVQHIIEIC